MELLRKVASFGTTIEDKKNIYILYVRSLLEQSCVVWHSSLTIRNSDDLERVQKAAVKVILGSSSTNYENDLDKLNLQSLKERREELCLKFAKKCKNNEKVKDIFQIRDKSHEMKTRKTETYEVENANTYRLKKSAIPYMQRLLNEDVQQNVIK